jgi:hypothetical protein
MSLDVYLEVVKPVEVYWANITHNLGKMADAAGIGDALWEPEKLHHGEIKAKDLIEALERGLADLEARPEYFKQFNAKNGWGMYKHFVPFVRNYLKACKENPEATVRVSR